MTKEKTKAPPLYIPRRITRGSVSNVKGYHMLASAELCKKMRWDTAYHTFVWGNGEREVEEISGIWEMGLHGRWEVELCQVWKVYAPKFLSGGGKKWVRPTFLDTNLSRAGLWLLLGRSLLGLLHAPYLWCGQDWGGLQVGETCLDHCGWMVAVAV